MLHHLPRKARQQCAAEMRRVLMMSGGRVLAVDFGLGARQRKGLLAHFHRHGHVKLTDIIGLLSEAGLTSIESGAVEVATCICSRGSPMPCPISNGMDPSSPNGIEVPDWKCHPPVNREKESVMKLIRVGVDLAKNVFQVHGVERNEQAVWRRKLSRENWLKVLLETVEPGCEIGMESCGGAHHWARRLQAHGFKVRMIAPQFVKPYVKSNKNDANDAEAICEAMSRPHMRFVSVKTVEQQDIQAVHRIRAELTKQRTAKANQIRGLVAEYGLVAPKELVHLRRALPCWLEDAENGLSERFRRLLTGCGVICGHSMSGWRNSTAKSR